MPTLPFNSVSDIKLTKLGASIEITVNGSVLGSINSGNPVTVFTTINGNIKNITLQNIGNAAYIAGNTNDPNTDTIQLRLNTVGLGFNIQSCSTNSSRYKIIGWETDTIGQICAGGRGSDGYYDISAPGNFKAMILTVNTEIMMVARYASSVNNPSTVGNSACDPALYCYACLS